MADLPNIKRTNIDRELIKQLKSEDDYVRVSIDLLIEVGSYVCVVANLYPDQRGWDLDQAVVGGHLVRLYKLVLAILDQSCQKRREILSVLARLAFECIINLRYLIKHASPELFKSFRAYSLKHEYKLRQDIIRNIRARGGQELEIERRMLSSIDHSFELSGIAQEEVPSEERNWGGRNVYEKTRDIGLEMIYLGVFSGPSHDVHGNWQDLLEYHLRADANYFFAELRWHPSRPQILNAVSLYTIDAVTDYLNWLTKGEYREMDANLSDLRERILRFVPLHEDFLSRSFSPEP